MSQFHYRLQPLLDQKIRQKDEAFQSLSEAQKKLRSEQEELEVCRSEQDQARRRISEARAQLILVGSKGTSGEWLCLKRAHIDRLGEEFKRASDATRAQELNVDEAEETVALARRLIAERTREVEVLEKHRTRLARKVLKKKEYLEALEQEEMANIIFIRGKRERNEG